MNSVTSMLSSIEQEIRKQRFGSSPKSLYDPIHYIMGLGGKRLRPLLAMLSYSLYEADSKKIVKYATAVEVFHNFTLLHDDIMDKAPLRRGKPTVHEKWNTNTAILSGDVMQIKVYDQFLDIEGKLLKEVLKALNQCATEVCEGQQWDMEFESMPHVTEQQYLEMIKLKTAVLLGFSLELGALLAKAPVRERKALKEFGINIGIGFQLKDDLLDVYADKAKFGKQVGGDIIANKKTYLLIKAKEKATGKDKKELEAWLSLKKFSKPQKVKAITSLYNRLNIYQTTEQKIQSYFEKGFKQLDTLKDSSQKKSLIAFTRNLINRQS
ncbi:MAG: polyprenyl synthetase family protein [Cyclobacteriaceae bacterium]|nr:polyprenyl synthetase family protein [Cyclobacteriaceae bacterium]